MRRGYCTSAAGGLADRCVRDLPSLLRSGDILVANDTKVIPAQLAARRGAARIGITLDRPRADGTWQALARNARRLRPGDTLTFDRAQDLAATVLTREADGDVTLAFDRRDAELADALRRAGAFALPPYIARPAGSASGRYAGLSDGLRAEGRRGRRPDGRAALHARLAGRFRRRGVKRVTVTLHVGAGTFLPVRTDDVGGIGCTPSVA